MPIVVILGLFVFAGVLTYFEVKDIKQLQAYRKTMLDVQMAILQELKYCSGYEKDNRKKEVK